VGKNLNEDEDITGMWMTVMAMMVLVVVLL